MTWAPCFAASSMYLRCFSTIESLSPVQPTWTRAAFTFAICLPPSLRALGYCAAGRSSGAASLARSRSDSLLALSVFTHLVARAAGVHVAPAAAVVLGAIDEEPRAGVVRALAQQRAVLLMDQHVRDGAGDRPERALKIIGVGPVPAEAISASDETRVTHGL